MTEETENKEIEEKDFSEENRRRLFLALAILFGANVKSYDNIPALYMNLARKTYEERNFAPKVEIKERLPERDIQIMVAEEGIADKVELFKIVGTKDVRTCKDCAEWQGKTVTVSGKDKRYKTVQDFINDHGFHINCRCSLQALDTKEIPRKPPNPRAYNSESDDTLLFFI